MDYMTGCTGKLPFETREHAGAAIASLKQRGVGESAGDLRVYRCPHCAAFHYGYRPGSGPTPRPMARVPTARRPRRQRDRLRRAIESDLEESP